MKCQASELDEIIKRASAFVPKMTTMDALKCFRFVDNTVQASSMHLGALLTLPGELRFDKPVFVNAEYFTSISKRLVGEVTISVIEKTMKMKISDATSSFTVPLIDPENFPSFPTCKTKYLKAPFIHPAVNAVKEFVMDPMSSRIEAGVHIADNVVVSTDHKVMAIAQIGTSTKIDDVLGPNIVGNFWDDLDSEMAIDENLVFVKSKDGVIFGNTMEGKFLDHTTFTRQWKFPLTSTIKLEALKKELPKLNVIGKEKDITWALCALSKGMLKMETTSLGGYVSVEIPVQGGGEARFRLNVQLVSKWMQNVHSEDIKMSCGEGLVQDTPIKFEGTIADDKTDVCVLTAYIMPMVYEVPKGIPSGSEE